jgi:probable HAF family extracellular repeat protein
MLLLTAAQGGETMTRCLSMTLLIGLALVVAQPAPGANLPAAPGYVITDLGSLGGGQTFPAAINVKGDVAGYSTTAAGQIHAFLLPAGGSMQDLGALGGAASYATGLNTRGDVVGYAATAGQTLVFALFDGQMIDLGLAGTAARKAVGINDLRQVLVVQDGGGGNASSLLWQNGQPLPLDTLGGSSTVGGGLNNLGQVVGNSTAADGTNHVFAYDSFLRRLIDLGDIGPKGIMTDVNEIGQAVGIRINRGVNIAFGADLQKVVLADEIIRRGFNGTDAYGINNENAAVGAGELSSPTDTNAGVWTADLQFTNLNQALIPNSGWTLRSANAINDAGVIVGRAVAPDGTAVAYMLAAQGPALAAEKAMAIAQSLDPAIGALQKGADTAAKATTPSALATALADLQQARSLLTPAAGDATLIGIRSGQASHLLRSTGNLLMSIPGDSPFLAASDRDGAITSITAAQNALQ